MQEAEAKNKFEVAQKSFDNKSYKKAQKIWSEIINYYPKNLSVLRNLSLAFYYDNNLEQTEIILKKIILINKKEPNALTMLILILEDQDKIDEAKEYIDIGLNEKLLDECWKIKKKLILPTIFKDLQDIDDSRGELEKNIDTTLNLDETTFLDIDTQLIKPVQFDLSYNQYDNLKINKKCISFYRKIIC